MPNTNLLFSADVTPRYRNPILLLLIYRFRAVMKLFVDKLIDCFEKAYRLFLVTQLRKIAMKTF